MKKRHEVRIDASETLPENMEPDLGVYGRKVSHWGYLFCSTCGCVSSKYKTDKGVALPLACLLTTPRDSFTL